MLASKKGFGSAERQTDRQMTERQTGDINATDSHSYQWKKPQLEVGEWRTAFVDRLRMAADYQSAMSM